MTTLTERVTHWKDGNVWLDAYVTERAQTPGETAEGVRQALLLAGLDKLVPLAVDDGELTSWPEDKPLGSALHDHSQADWLFCREHLDQLLERWEGEAMNTVADYVKAHPAVREFAALIMAVVNDEDGKLPANRALVEKRVRQNYPNLSGRGLEAIVTAIGIFGGIEYGKP